MVNLCLSFLIFGLLETSYKRNMLVYDGLSKNNISHFEGFVDQTMVIKMKCVVNCFQKNITICQPNKT